ncbi:hypothetical protein MYSTI_07694 [Myxococcus stipitatus DSM 14675]|uniref:Uncharacterized protein n=1 Tax=Myxococcus stipitatus (strain DSM 14675 / JCM 12634 / Mx s8) TaxID=1278073 RepID=L7UJ23_MYXSD|nr:DUF6438 domain-containing protein [Myxococcus stipitatus]AGC48966.1 hypothetical protein MYSTI_07694 [Myxococcus stipitatus DSM 14675]
MRRTQGDTFTSAYSIQAYSDGCVVYEGRDLVESQGRHEFRLTEAQLGHLRKLLTTHVRTEEVYGDAEGRHYACPHGELNAPGIVLLAPEVGVTRPICYPDYASMAYPSMLGGVDYAIDEVLGSARWTGCKHRVTGLGGC